MQDAHQQMTRHGKLRTKEALRLPKWVPAVEGSFDDPPIVLRQDRLKLALNCLPLTALAALILWLPTIRYSTAHFFVLGLLGFGAAVYALQAIFPATLILDPTCLVLRSAFRTVEYQWCDFARFRWYSYRFVWRLVCGDYTEAFKARQGWRRFLAGTAGLGGYWELPAQRVTDVLNEALARWGAPTDAATTPRRRAWAEHGTSGSRHRLVNRRKRTLWFAPLTAGVTAWAHTSLFFDAPTGRPVRHLLFPPL